MAILMPNATFSELNVSDCVIHNEYCDLLGRVLGTGGVAVLNRELSRVAR